MTSLMQRVIQIVDRHSRPNQPSPQFTIKAMLERSLLLEQINEHKAQLETYRAQEAEFRALLVASYVSMAHAAERAKFKLETREWKDGATLTGESERLGSALEAHNNCLDAISSLIVSIEDDQNDLDDAELWEQVVSA